MLIIHNAKIYTLDPGRPVAAAIAIEHGHITAIGSDQEILDGFDGVRFDARKRIILPGLVDAHIHLENYALALDKIACETKTKEECLHRVAVRAAQHTPGEWILGHGWNQNQWTGGYGSVEDLDSVTLHNPVYLTAKSLHAGWANSRALQTAGISRDTPDPPGGLIGRRKDGEPNGILFESAMELINNVIPQPTINQVENAIRKALPTLWRFGITAVHDFDRRRCFAALQSLNLRGELKLRVHKGIPVEDLPHVVAIGMRAGFGNAMLRIGHVKAFADGALGPRTAAMFKPYTDEPDNRGMLQLDAEEITEFGRLAVNAGLPLAIHAIGDRAIHEVLDAYAHLKAYENDLLADGQLSKPLRHRIEHVQVLHPDDASRLASLGVIASMQPYHAISDMEMADRYWGARAMLSYAWKTQLESGAKLAFGSDAPIEEPNPFWGLHAAITRQKPDGSPDPNGWYPEQRISLYQAIQAYTTGPAYAASIEDRAGMLAAGYYADLILLDNDPFLCRPEELRDIHPSGTMIGGEWVYQR